MEILDKSTFIEMSATDRGIIDEIIFTLNTISNEKCISYDKEIKWLNRLREL